MSFESKWVQRIKEKTIHLSKKMKGRGEVTMDNSEMRGKKLQRECRSSKEAVTPTYRRCNFQGAKVRFFHCCRVKCWLGSLPR